MRLNSSKHAQAPLLARPLKNLAIVMQSRVSLQLNTTHCLASALARSLVVSVLPVPAGLHSSDSRSAARQAEEAVSNNE
jgi:hypothetical protein